jgi:HEAT repeat protein
MRGIQLTQQVVLVVFAFNALMMLAMIFLKTLHRRRMAEHDRRYSVYVALLSRHMTFENCTDPIEPKATAQRAFLDALIDVRNTVVGPEAQTISGIVARFGVVNSLARSLTRPWPRGRRLRAAVALAELGDESSARLLMDHLDDKDPEVRLQAARGLGRMQWTPAIDSIVERFGIEEPWVRSRFADTLMGFGRKATWPLAAYMRVNHRHEVPGTVAALEALAAIGDGEAVTPILDVLEQGPDPEVAITAIQSLGLLGGATVVRPLEEASGSADWRVRAKAVTALGEIGDPGSRGVLAGHLRDENYWVRRNTAASLARIPGGTKDLLDALEGDDPYAADAAAEALVDRGDLSAARIRVREGTASAADFRLLAYIDEDDRVAS